MYNGIQDLEAGSILRAQTAQQAQQARWQHQAEAQALNEQYCREFARNSLHNQAACGNLPQEAPMPVKGEIHFKLESLKTEAFALHDVAAKLAARLISLVREADIPKPEDLPEPEGSTQMGRDIDSVTKRVMFVRSGLEKIIEVLEI